MKTPQTSIILSAIALVASMIAIAIQFPPMSAYVSAADDGQGTETAEPTSASAKSVTEKESDASVAESSKTDESLKETLDVQAKRIAMLETQLSKLQHVIRSAGLDAAAPYLTPPPGSSTPLLAQMGEQYATRARFEEKRKKMLEHSEQMRQRDMDTYGAQSYQAIADLYEKARPTRGNATPEEKAQREAALSSLMSNYPEAWSTSVAVAEQALDAAMNRDVQSAETYYQSLVESSPYTEVVTDQGINAIPTLQTYLARQYVSEGRYDEATSILDALSAQSDTVILEPNDMGQPTAKSAQDIVTELRSKMSQ